MSSQVQDGEKRMNVIFKNHCMMMPRQISICGSDPNPSKIGYVI